MSKHECKYDVAVYLRGDALDPDVVSKAVGPSRSQRKGGKKPNSEFVAKIGVWALEAEAQSNDLTAFIQELSSKVGAAGLTLARIAGVEEAYLDVLVITIADDDGGGTCEFRLTPEASQALVTIGLPARFTVSVVKK